jgi:hypothetical protein
LRQAIAALREVNANLESVMLRNDKVIRRQNWLTGLFLLSLGMLGGQLFLGLSQQALQESAKTQLAAQEQGRIEMQRALEAAKIQVRELETSMKQQLQAVPTVTSDKAGRLSLEVPLDDATKQAVSATPTLPPEKVVIPLKPSQAKLSN